MHALPVSLFSLLLLAPPADGWLGVFLDGERDEAVVTEVIPDSPAAKAGLQVGDVFLAVGDKETATRDAFVAAIQAGQAGDRVSIKLRRDGKERTVVVKLGKRPETVGVAEPAAPEHAERGGKPAAPAAEAAPAAPSQPKRAYLGLSVRETDDGVVVDRVLPDGPAKALHASEGTVITSLGDHQVKTLDDLDRFLQGAKPGRKVAVGLRDAEGVRSVTVMLGERPAAGPRDEVEVAPLAAAKVEPRRLRAREAAPAERKPEPAAQEVDLEAELAALRAELADLRRQLEELRKGKGRE
ncbi:MAG TPA: PDZ domain-containing protein [Planctomycetota bacterium]|nr:PDZ domain-containing protein [Planctomycetota bacterium]